MDITIESIAQACRDLEVERDAADLDMFLSDNWHTYRILREGGRLIEVGGKTIRR
jgi:hypothetical protein